MKNLFNNLFYITKVIIIIAPFLILGFLIKKDLVFSGHLEFVYDFSKGSPAITNLFPADRMSPINQIAGTENHWQQIEQEPVYFETRVPQTFKKATVEIIFKNQNQPLIQVGLRTIGAGDWNYDFRPLENQILDNIYWSKIENESYTLWQKTKKYLTLEQFLDRIDYEQNVAAYYSLVNGNKIESRDLISHETDIIDLDYLISNYKTPQTLEDGWKINQVDFDLTNARIENRKLRFIISIPKLEQEQDVIPIKQIKVSLDKEPLTWAEFWKKSFNFIKMKF